MKGLTEKEIEDISIGYNWNPDMSYDDFIRKNENVTYSNGHELYDLINERYIVYKFS